jgi:Fe-S cluster biogenesis protein NfuA
MQADRVAQLEAHLADVDALPGGPARDTALAALQGLLELYGDGLARIVELAPEVMPRLVQDELVSHLLLLHGLHPEDVATRVESALESIRPYLASHGGNVELLAVSDAVARVRLQGTCNGCPSSTATLKNAIEEAIFKMAPDIERVEAEAASPALIALENLVCPLP